MLEKNKNKIIKFLTITAIIVSVFLLLFLNPSGFADISINFLSSILSFGAGAIVVFLLMTVGGITFGGWLISAGYFITGKGRKIQKHAKSGKKIREDY